MRRSLCRSFFTSRRPKRNRNQTTNAQSPRLPGTCMLRLPNSPGRVHVGIHTPFSQQTSSLGHDPLEVRGLKTVYRALPLGDFTNNPVVHHVAEKKHEDSKAARGLKAGYRITFRSGMSGCTRRCWADAKKSTAVQGLESSNYRALPSLMVWYLRQVCHAHHPGGELLSCNGLFTMKHVRLSRITTEAQY